MSSSDSSFSVPGVSDRVVVEPQTAEFLRGTHTLDLLLLLGLLSGGATGSGTTSGRGGSIATGADDGQEILDVLALKSL